MKREILILLCLICLFLPLSASAQNSSRVESGFQFYYFDYKEDLPDPLKSTERGWLPGIYVNFEHRYPSNVCIQIGGSYAGGEIKYDGTSQTGIPVVDNDSRQDFFRFNADIGYAFPSRGKISFQPFIGYGYRFWKRSDAKMVSNVIFYREDYVWHYLREGLKINYRLNKNWTFGNIFTLNHMLYGEMKAYLSEVQAGSNDLEFELGNKLGIMIEFPATYQIQPKWSVVISPWYEYSAFGQSNTTAQTVNGVRTGDHFYEPSSRTHQIGVNTAITYSF
jgi:hypothetical protein